MNISQTTLRIGAVLGTTVDDRHEGGVPGSLRDVHRQRVQPLQHAVPPTLFDERRWVGLVDGVREQQRHDVGERRDVRDARLFGAPRQQRDLAAPLVEDRPVGRAA